MGEAMVLGDSIEEVSLQRTFALLLGILAIVISGILLPRTREVRDPSSEMVKGKKLSTLLPVVMFILGMIIWQEVAPSIFPGEGDAINTYRSMIAGIVGAGTAVLGYVIGRIIEGDRAN